jgi:hypothetical protein
VTIGPQFENQEQGMVIAPPLARPSTFAVFALCRVVRLLDLAGCRLTEAQELSLLGGDDPWRPTAPGGANWRRDDVSSC